MMPNSFERHVQTVIQIILAALLVWVGYSTVAMRESVVKLEVRNEHMERRLTEMAVELSGLRSQVTTAATAAASAASAAAAMAAKR